MIDKKELDAILELASLLIRNRCVNDGISSAGEERNTRLLESFFAEAGLKTDTVCSPGKRANLYFIGEERKDVPVYGLMGHTDVVPAGSAQWSFDPFCGDIRNGRLLGRGSVDMLGQLAAMAAAVRTHAVTGEGKNVRFFAMADEEADGTEGAAWFTETYPDLIRCDAVFSELGGFFLRDDGIGETALVCAEKGVARVRLTATGKGGHGSLPYKSDNALVKAAAALGVLERELSYPVMTAGYLEFVDGLPLPSLLKERLKNTETVDRAIDEAAELSFGLAKYLHGASRLTVMPGVMRSGTKVNVVPDRAVVDLDLRLPETMSRIELEENLNRLTPVLEGAVGWELTEFTAGNRSAADTAAVRDAVAAAGRIAPGIRPVPFVSGGVSDSRFWRQKGVASYGFTVFSKDITIDTYSRLIHGKDESITVDSLETMYRFYRELLK